MTIETYIPRKLLVDVCDWIPGVVKQRALIIGQGSRHDEGTDEFSATIEVLVLRYSYDATAPGGYGELMSGFPEKREILHGSDNTLVDAADGSPLYQNKGGTNAEYDAVANTISAQLGITVMRQGQYYAKVRDTKQVIMADEMLPHVAIADLMGRFGQPA